MTADWVIETEGLTRRFGSRLAVQGLTLRVPRGSVFGFLGLNAAGKTTSIRMMMGLLRRNGGTVSVLGLDPSRDSVEIKRRVGYVADSTIFYDWMTVDETCAFVGAYHRPKWSESRRAMLLEKLRLPTQQRVGELSKGQRAKLALTLALSFDPEMLILDEPMTGLDPLARREFIEGVLAEYQESGKTVFISSHLVSELSGLIDHVGILDAGQLVWTGPTEEFVASLWRVRLTFSDAVPTGLACTGMIGLKLEGRDALVSIHDASREAALAELKSFGPAEIEVETLGLEDAFVEFISAKERQRK